MVAASAHFKACMYFCRTAQKVRDPGRIFAQPFQSGPQAYLYDQAVEKAAPLGELRFAKAAAIT